MHNLRSEKSSSHTSANAFKRRTVGTILAVVTSLILISIFSNDVDALQQIAGPIIYELQPGQSGTLQWSLLSDSDRPVTLELHVDGQGSDLVSFPKTVTIESGQLVKVDVTVTIPDNYQNDVLFKPAIYATQFGEAGGTTTINVAMKKVLTIKIGNPVDSEIELQKPSLVQPQTESKDYEEQAKPSGGLMIKSDEIDPEPQANPTFTQAQAKPQETGGGCLIATAAYGSELAPQVQMLREIRDVTVFGTGSGVTFMGTFNQIYYSFSPTIADLERQSPIFKEFVRAMITPMLTMLTILDYVDIDSENEMIGYGLLLIGLNIVVYLIGPTFAIVYVKKLAHKIQNHRIHPNNQYELTR